MSKNTSPTLVTLGKLGAVHGIRGWLKIHSYTQNPTDIFNYPDWIISNQGKNTRKIIKPTDWKNHSGKLLVKLEGFNNPEASRLLTGMLIQISKSDLPEKSEDEYYWAELIGLHIIDQNGHDLGKVIDLMETGSNDVLIIKGEKEHAIPYLPNVILKVDLDEQKILVDWEIL